MATSLFTGFHNCQVVEDLVHPYVFPHLTVFSMWWTHSLLIVLELNRPFLGGLISLTGTRLVSSRIFVHGNLMIIGCCCQSHRLSEHPASTFEAKLPVTTTMAISSGKRNMADRDGGVARLWVGGITQRRRRTFTKMFGWYADVSSFHNICSSSGHPRIYCICTDSHTKARRNVTTKTSSSSVRHPTWQWKPIRV